MQGGGQGFESPHLHQEKVDGGMFGERNSGVNTESETGWVENSDLAVSLGRCVS